MSTNVGIVDRLLRLSLGGLLLYLGLGIYGFMAVQL
ncbi:YgaP-like transmembrane domain [Acaryochloris sp. CCMEE 5410]|nr:YgaP-like transmembrane domain [Acaryochloris sp. CCMEE 5410]